MAKKNYTGMKVTILGLSAAATMFGTAWLSQHDQSVASSTTESATTSQQPGTFSASTSTASSAQAQTATPKPVTVTRAKKSRAS